MGPEPVPLSPAFLTTRHGLPELYVMNADGSGQLRLTRTGTALEQSAAWAPDGQQIVFARGWRDVNQDIYVMKADGSDERRLTYDDQAGDHSPEWSPDGRMIAFLSERDGKSEIYVMNADGSEQRNLTRTAASEGDFAWSPDGRKIAYSTRGRIDGENVHVYVMNADGTGPRRLTRGGRPRWSSDGTKIAFARVRNDNADVYVMNADGSRQRNITRSPWDESIFAWSPKRTKRP